MTGRAVALGMGVALFAQGWSIVSARAIPAGAMASVTASMIRLVLIVVSPLACVNRTVRVWRPLVGRKSAVRRPGLFHDCPAY